MRAWALAFLLAFLTGCAMLERSGSEPMALDPEEVRFARSLAFYAQGLIHEQLSGRESSAAAEAFTEATRLSPGQHLLAAKAALAELQRNNGDQALAILRDSAERNPGSVQSWLDLAAVAQVSDRLDQAIDAYRRVRALDPASAFAHLSLAKLYFRTRQDARALETMENAFRTLETPAAMLSFGYSQAREFIAQGEITRSIPCFRMVARHTPSQRPEFHTLLGELYASLEYADEAGWHYREAIRLPDAPAATYVKYATFSLRANPEHAIEILQQGDRRHPNDPGILFLLASAYSRLEQFRSAVDTFDRVAALIPETDEQKLSAAFFLFHGSASERAGDLEKAERIFLRGLEVYPDDDAMQNYLAYMWAERGHRLDEALELVTKALQTDPDNGAYLDTLGWIYFKKALYQEALETIRKAHAIVSDDAVVNDHLGDAYKALDEKDKAVSFWTESFRIDPGNARVASKLSAHGIDVERLRRDAQRTRSAVGDCN